MIGEAAAVESEDLNDPSVRGPRVLDSGGHEPCERLGLARPGRSSGVLVGARRGPQMIEPDLCGRHGPTSPDQTRARTLAYPSVSTDTASEPAPGSPNTAVAPGAADQGSQPGSPSSMNRTAAPWTWSART